MRQIMLGKVSAIRKLLKSEVDKLYPIALLVLCAAVLFSVNSWFGLGRWQSWLGVILAVVAILFLPPIWKRRRWGILASTAVCVFGYFGLFGWVASPAVETTGQVLDKDYFVSSSRGVSFPHYTVTLGFDGRTKNVEIFEGMYNSMNRHDEVVIRYHTEELVIGLMEHLVVESVDSQLVWKGGGMQIGAPGTNQFGAWTVVVLCALPLLLMVIGAVYYRGKPLGKFS